MALLKNTIVNGKLYADRIITDNITTQNNKKYVTDEWVNQQGFIKNINIDAISGVTLNTAQTITGIKTFTTGVPRFEGNSDGPATNFYVHGSYPVGFGTSDAATTLKIGTVSGDHTNWDNTHDANLEVTGDVSAKSYTYKDGNKTASIVFDSTAKCLRFVF